jgi:hypothetical protein
MWRQSWTVIKNPHYALIMASVFIVMFVMIIILPSMSFVYQFASIPGVTAIDVSKLIGRFIISSPAILGPLGFLYTVLISALFALNVGCITYYIFHTKGTQVCSALSQSGAGLLGGLFGIGCATCGSLVAASFLSIIGAGGIILALPLQGAEFAIAGSLLLLLSSIIILKKIEHL